MSCIFQNFIVLQECAMVILNILNIFKIKTNRKMSRERFLHNRILICSKPTYKCIYSKTTVMWSLQYISLQFINHFYIRHFKEKLRFCNLKKNAAHIAIGIKNRQQESFSLLIWNTSSFRIRYDKSAICANCLNYLCD